MWSQKSETFVCNLYTPEDSKECGSMFDCCRRSTLAHFSREHSELDKLVIYLLEHDNNFDVLLATKTIFLLPEPPVNTTIFTKRVLSPLQQPSD